MKILRSTVGPKDVMGLLPEKLKPLVENFRQHVVRDPAQVQMELESNPTAMPKVPYWDPKLKRDVALRRQLFRHVPPNVSDRTFGFAAGGESQSRHLLCEKERPSICPADTGRSSSQFHAQTTTHHSAWV